MRVHLIRHGMTEANKKHLYCGCTDLPLIEQGKQHLFSLKDTLIYPTAVMHITSGLLRATETLRILYGKEPDVIIEDFKEMNFGKFEMKSYDDLKDKPEYQQWINDIDNVSCPGGESRNVFEHRVMAGLSKLFDMEVESAVIVCHGGVIVSVMERFFPGQKNFYELLPSYGRGYTLDITFGVAALISEV